MLALAFVRAHEDAVADIVHYENLEDWEEEEEVAMGMEWLSMIENMKKAITKKVRSCPYAFKMGYGVSENVAWSIFYLFQSLEVLFGVHIRTPTLPDEVLRTSSDCKHMASRLCRRINT